MGKPIFLVAGQSNASNLESEVASALRFLLPADSCHFGTVADPGSPLTWARGDGLKDWATRGELPMQLLGTITALLDADPTARLGGVVWLQGEADTLDLARASEYAVRLEALFDWLRAELSARYGNRDIGLDTFRVVLSGLSDHAASATRDKWDDIQAQLADAAEAPGVVLVDPDAVAAQEGVAPSQMFRDELHYGDGFAQSLADALVEALIAPGLTSPFASRDGSYTSSTGADWIDPGPGGQALAGGLGNDTYIIDSAFDRVAEDYGCGDDRVIANVSFVLRDHSQALEGLILTGSGDLSGTGNGLNNLIRGNLGANDLRGAWGDDVVYGRGGNDELRGGIGRDTLIGGRGDDRYWLDSVGDRVVEAAGAGHDTVFSTVGVELWRMSQSIEDLVLTGTDNLTGVGNMQANRIEGNAGANYLNGGGGRDLLLGADGNDTLLGDRDSDTLTGGAGADAFIFRTGHGQDVVTDLSAGDRLTFLGLDRGDVILRQDGSDVALTYGPGDGVRLLDVTLAEVNDALSFG